METRTASWMIGRRAGPGPVAGGRAATATAGAGRAARAGGFSLAEMMIALVILGFGLLIVGAALPVGLRYTRDTVDRGTGDAAVDYGLNLVEQTVRLMRDPYHDPSEPDPDPAIPLERYADLFQPRYGPGDPAGGTPGMLARENPTDLASRLWEPVFKVRPLLAVAIVANTSSMFAKGDEITEEHYLDLEKRIAERLMLPGAALPFREFDYYDPPAGGSHWVMPPLPSVCAVYPPIAPDQPFTVEDFFDQPYGQKVVSEAERFRSMSRRFMWTAFYRRVSYAEGSDPNLYEFIVVVLRVPADGYRFPRFEAATGAKGTMPYSEGLGDTVAPVPALAIFDRLPELKPVEDYSATPDRVLRPGFVDPANLTFIASEQVGRLLPSGSLIIPALNDDAPSALKDKGVTRWAGFTPHAPDALPVYEVTSRSWNDANGQYEIFVRNNGFYPWVEPAAGDPGARAAFWPVWIVPPAFKELDSAGDPVFEDRSPIVAWGRRVVRLREIP